MPETSGKLSGPAYTGSSLRYQLAPVEQKCPGRDYFPGRNVRFLKRRHEHRRFIRCFRNCVRAWKHSACITDRVSGQPYFLKVVPLNVSGAPIRKVRIPGGRLSTTGNYAWGHAQSALLYIREIPVALLFFPEKCSVHFQILKIIPWNALQERSVISGRTVTAGEIMQDLLHDRIFFRESGGGVTISGGEPLYRRNSP